MKKTWIFGVAFTLCLFITACCFCVGALFAPVPVFAVESGLTVVLDAGHGGVDGGVTGKKTGVKESEINLSITLKLKELFQDAGFQVTLTRKTSAGLYGAATKGFKKRDMQKRKEIIEEAKPDFVISVHQNFYPSTASRGGQVFYPKEDEWACRLAGNIQAEFNTLYQKEGVKARKETAGDYYMLRLVPPSVIVECGFLSNSEECELLCAT